MVFCNTLNSSCAVDHFLTENQISTVNYHGEVPAEERFVFVFPNMSVSFLIIYLNETIIPTVELRTWTSSGMMKGIAQHWYALIWQLEAWTWMSTMSSCLTSHQTLYVLFCAVFTYIPTNPLLILTNDLNIFWVFRLIISTELGELHAWEPKVLAFPSYNWTRLLALLHLFLMSHYVCYHLL
jgi:hypothetical protein